MMKVWRFQGWVGQWLLFLNIKYYLKESFQFCSLGLRKDIFSESAKVIVHPYFGGRVDRGLKDESF